MKTDVKSHVIKLVLAALFAALTCVATVLFPIQIPLGGYVNFGDCIVLLGAWMLGPVYGSLAAGIGSMLADMIYGYFTYAPGTFAIKALVALAASLLFKVMNNKASNKLDFIFRIISGFCGELIMVFGYFAYEAVFLGLGLGAVANIPWNSIQSAFGIVASVILIQIMVKNKALNKYYTMLQ